MAWTDELDSTVWVMYCHVGMTPVPNVLLTLSSSISIQLILSSSTLAQRLLPLNCCFNPTLQNPGKTLPSCLGTTAHRLPLWIKLPIPDPIQHLPPDIQPRPTSQHVRLKLHVNIADGVVHISNLSCSCPVLRFNGGPSFYDLLNSINNPHTSSNRLFKARAQALRTLRTSRSALSAWTQPSGLPRGKDTSEGSDKSKSEVKSWIRSCPSHEDSYTRAIPSEDEVANCYWSDNAMQNTFQSLIRTSSLCIAKF